MINMIDVLDRSNSEMEYRKLILDLPGSGLGIYGARGCKAVPKNLTRSRDFSWLYVFLFDSWDL